MLITTESMFYVKMFTAVNDKLFSEWLIDELRLREMSQADLARKSNLTTGGVSNLINQVRKPNPETCIAIARALNIPPETVFRKAGILQTDKEKDELTEEAEFLLKQLPDFQRRQAIDFIRFLAEQKGDYVTKTMEKDEHP